MPEVKPAGEQPQQPAQEDSKQLKKLLESHLSVLEHKLKRPPTMEELLMFVKGTPEGEGEAIVAKAQGQAVMTDEKAGVPQEGQAPQAEAEPKVLSYKVSYGMNAGKPDPKRVLFYQTGDGRCYDTTNHQWCEQRPSIVDHLPSRDMMFDEQGHDIMSALVHGVLDDEDYASLDKACMLNDHHKKIWELNKKLQSQVGQLEKSEEVESPASEDEKPSDTASEAEKNDYGSEAFEDEDEPQAEEQAQPADTPKGDTPPTNKESAPAAKGEESGEPTEGDTINVIEEILRVALANAQADGDQKIKDLVASEFKRHMEGFIAAMDQGSEPEPTQDFPTAQPTG